MHDRLHPPNQGSMLEPFNIKMQQLQSPRTRFSDVVGARAVRAAGGAGQCSQHVIYCEEGEFDPELNTVGAASALVIRRCAAIPGGRAVVLTTYSNVNCRHPWLACSANLGVVRSGSILGAIRTAGALVVFSVATKPGSRAVVLTLEIMIMEWRGGRRGVLKGSAMAK